MQEKPLVFNPRANIMATPSGHWDITCPTQVEAQAYVTLFMQLYRWAGVQFEIYHTSQEGRQLYDRSPERGF